MCNTETDSRDRQTDRKTDRQTEHRNRPPIDNGHNQGEERERSRGDNGEKNVSVNGEWGKKVREFIHVFAQELSLNCLGNMRLIAEDRPYPKGVSEC